MSWYPAQIAGEGNFIPGQVPASPGFWTQPCVSWSRALSTSKGAPAPHPLSRLTLAMASGGHAVPAVAVFTPEGPHGIDAVPFPADVWPQALINIYAKQKTLSSFISQNRVPNLSHLPG